MYGPGESSFWKFPLPFAGDLGVTCLVQGLATYLIVPSLVLLDVRSKRVSPLAEVWPRPIKVDDEMSAVSKVVNWVLVDHGEVGVLLIPLDLVIAWKRGDLKGLDGGTVAKRVGLRVLSQIVKGALWGAALFFLFWCVWRSKFPLRRRRPTADPRTIDPSQAGQRRYPRPFVHAPSHEGPYPRGGLVSKKSEQSNV